MKKRILSKNKGHLFFLLPKIYQVTEYYTMFARKIFLSRIWAAVPASYTPTAYTTGILYFSFLRRSICYHSCIFHSCIFSAPTVVTNNQICRCLLNTNPLPVQQTCILSLEHCLLLWHSLTLRPHAAFPQALKFNSILVINLLTFYNTQSICFYVW